MLNWLMFVVILFAFWKLDAAIQTQINQVKTQLRETTAEINAVRAAFNEQFSLKETEQIPLMEEVN